MKQIYFQKKPDNPAFNLWKPIILLLGIVVCANMAFAQSEMTWTGATSNNFLIEDNWEPPGSPSGNNLTIPMQTDSSLAPHALEVTGSENVSINWMYVEFATEDTYQPTITINLDSNTDTFTVVTGWSSNCDYGFTGMIIKRGHYRYMKKNAPRLDEANCWLRVEGGIAEFYNLGMGQKSDGTRAGKIYISGDGQVIVGVGADNFFRYWEREDGQIEITENGKLIVNADFTSPFDNWINGGENYSVRRSYDAVTNVTTFSAVPSTYIGISNSDRQVMKNGEVTTDTLTLLETTAVTSAATYQWRYRKTGEDTYTNFTGEGANTIAFAPSFESSGTYFVSCLVDGTATDNEVEFYVVSNAISFLPAEFELQYVRIGEFGTTMTAAFTTTPSSVEWKYSTIPGGPYSSFEPAATTESFAPFFNETGNNYVVMEAVINGQTHTSTELLYNVESATSTGKELTWTGLISSDATEPANWSPVASFSKNSITINDLGDGANYPELTLSGNDTIYNIFHYGGTFTINQGVDGEVDTLNVRGGNVYIQAPLVLNNAAITYESLFWRIPTYTGQMTLNGSSTLDVLYVGSYDASILMGEKGTTNGDGGVLTLNDDSQVKMLAFFRMQPGVSDSSVIAVNDNALLFYRGDGRTEIQTYIDSTKIRCDDEGYVPTILYPYEYNDSIWTVVKARNTNAFSIEDDSRTFTTAGYETENAIGLVNTSGVSGWEWKWSTNVGGPWNSFEPAATGETCNPLFAESGDYYVIAVTTDGLETSNMKQVTVIEMAINPSEEQNIELGASCEQLDLSLSIPEGLTLLNGYWFYKDEFEIEYETGVSDTFYLPPFETAGTYYVYYFAEVQDENAVSYSLFSNIVTIVYGADAVNEMALGGFKIYPNPTTGTFYFDTTFESDYKVEILDLNGKVVFSKFCQAMSSEAVEFSRKGMYVVKLQTDNEIKISRLVVR